MREPVGLNRLKTSWEKGPEAHLNLWRRLRAGGRQVRVVAVAWEPSLLTRAGRVLSTWVGKDSQDENAPDTLRKAIAEGDWETIEQHGGLNEVMSRIGKRAEGGRIDGFTLWWPERCRQIGAHPTKGAWCAEVVRGTEPFSRRRHPPPPVAGLPPKMPESAPVKGSGEPLQPPPAERYGPAGHSPVRQVTRRTDHHGGSAPPPVRLRRLRGGRAGAPAGAPQLSLPAGVAPSNQSLREGYPAAHQGPPEASPDHKKGVYISGSYRKSERSCT